MCVPEDGVSMAIDLMWDFDCGNIPVVKDLDSKELVGIVTDRDIAMCVVKHRNVHPNEVRVIDCMSTPVFSCNADDPIEIALQIMSENRIRRIPVIDENGSCLGIISQADLVLNASDVESIIDVLQQISVPYTKAQAELSDPNKEKETSSDSDKEIVSSEKSDSDKEEETSSASKAE